jgi:hypothetical protein
MYLMFTCMWCISFCYCFPLKGMRANNHFPAVSLTPRGIWCGGIIATAESASAVSFNHGFFLQKCPSQIPRYHWHRGIWSHGIIDTTGSDPAVSLSPMNPNFSNDYLDFPGEYEAKCETALAHEWGHRGDCLILKKPRVENLVTLPL